MEEGATELVMAFGDKTADVIEQLNKGNWVDDHGHPVQLNKSINELADVLERATEWVRESRNG